MDQLRTSGESTGTASVISGQTRSTETVEPQVPYEDRQAILGKEWAEIYSDLNRKLVNTSEIILRNPAVYSRDIDRLNLPEELRDKWRNLSAFADSVSTVAAVKPIDWGNVKGLDRIQSMVFRGDINPDFRGTIGDIMKASSNLFSESVKLSPGDTDYFKGNVVAAEAWIREHHQAPPISTPQ